MVSDTGIGISKDRISAIFEQFTQVDSSTTRKFGGTGLGLTICKHLVTMMGGNIGVESEEEKGSTFSFSIRFSIDQEAALSSEEHKMKREQYHHRFDHLAGVPIVLADKNPTGCGIVKKMLIHLGAEVETVDNTTSLQDSLRLAQSENRPFHVILLDHALLSDLEEWQPGQAKHSLLGNNNNVLILSDHNRINNPISHHLLKKATFLLKPVKLSKLVKEIDHILGRTVAVEVLTTDPALQTHNHSRPMRILLVDDMVNNRILASKILEQAGHTVTMAYHGREALKQLATAPSFDLVLMDLQMPEMDGYETTKLIRKGKAIGKSDPRIPIIAVTARAMPKEKEACLTVGMNGYVRKPYQAADLLAAIEPFVHKNSTKQSGKRAGKLKKQLQKGKRPILAPVETRDEHTLQIRRQVFLEEGSEHVQRLGKALQDRKVQRTLKETEWIKKAAVDIGASRLKIRAIRLKGTAEIHSWDDSLKIFNDLQQEFQKTIQALLSLEEKA